MKVCRYNWHSAGSLGRSFPMLKYKYIFQIRYTVAILSNSTRKMLWFEITKMLIAGLKQTCVIYYDFRHTFVPCMRFVCETQRWDVGTITSPDAAERVTDGPNRRSAALGSVHYAFSQSQLNSGPGDFSSNLALQRRCPGRPIADPLRRPSERPCDSGTKGRILPSQS